MKLGRNAKAFCLYSHNATTSECQFHKAKVRKLSSGNSNLALEYFVSKVSLE